MTSQLHNSVSARWWFPELSSPLREPRKTRRYHNHHTAAKGWLLVARAPTKEEYYLCFFMHYVLLLCVLQGVDPRVRASRWFSQPLFDDVLADADAEAVEASQRLKQVHIHGLHACVLALGHSFLSVTNTSTVVAINCEMINKELSAVLSLIENKSC